MKRSNSILLGALLLTSAMAIGIPLHVRLTGNFAGIAEKLGEPSRVTDKPGPQWKPVPTRGPDWTPQMTDTSAARANCDDTGMSVLNCADTYRIVGTSASGYDWFNGISFRDSSCQGEKTISVKFKIPRHGKDGHISLEYDRVILSYRWGNGARPQKGEYLLSAYGHSGTTRDGVEFDHKWKFVKGWGHMARRGTEEKEFSELKIVISPDRYTISSYVNSKLIGTQKFQNPQFSSMTHLNLSVPNRGSFTDLYITGVRSRCK